ncbi:MAG TPA: hypothetical protein VKV57_05505 [bacterium]|nr:hypothetical protein [bacterium]
MRKRLLTFTLAAAIAVGMTPPRLGVAQLLPATFPSIHVEVTGDPTPVETLRLAILTAARAEVPEVRGGRVALQETAPPLQPLPLAAEMALRAVVQVSSSGLRSLTATVPVEITNASFPWADAGELLVSNSPETLSFGKVLLDGALSTGQTVRLLYHHQNGSAAQHMTIAVNLSNPARTPIELWLMGSAGNAGGDELVIGHAAAHAFLDQYWHHAGFILRIPPNTTVPLFLHDLAPGAVASGLVQLGLIDGDRLNLQVFARLDGETDPPTASYAPNVDKIHRRGVFEHPYLVRPLSFTVGDPLLSMMVGDDLDALHESQTGAALNGNYGVVYTFPVELDNPRPLPALLGLVMHADGGQAGATILADDRVFDIPQVRSGDRRLVMTIHLAPGEHRRLVISTMPESGANYPIRLTLGSQYQ